MWLKGRFNLVRASAFALSLSALAFPAAGQTARRDASASKVDIANIAIDNFGRVDSTYFRGAQPKGRDYADLAALGVKTLIDLTSDDSDPAEQGMSERAGMHYVHIPMTTHVSPTAEQLEQFMKIVSDPANQPVYVHCVGGRHRTGVMTAVYRMNHDSWTPDRAFSEMKNYKFGADFLHSEFKDFVYGYQAAAAAAATTSAVSTKLR
jgi:tyrosine-protein phosphatase SIW14